MKRRAWIALALILFIFGGVPPGHAETAVTSVPTPVISTSRGTVSSLDTQSANPWLKLKDPSGKEWTIMIDPVASSVWKGGAQADWADIKVGDKVEVRHTEKDGKVLAKTIEID